MKRSFTVAVLLACAWLWLFGPRIASQARGTPSPAFTYSPIVANLMAQVQSADVYSYTARLSGDAPVIVGGQTITLSTRNSRSGLPIQQATQYAYEQLQAAGLSASYHTWTACSITNGRNVIGVITGTLTPDEIVLITGHLDDMPATGRAPGADDNASGSVGVLLAAQLMQGQPFERTVRFVLFTGEEQGLCGSGAYADTVFAAGENIVAVYNMDMIAWDGTGGPTLRLHTRTIGNTGYPADLAIAGVFTNVVQTYGLSGSLTPIISADGENASDHSEFWAKGYPAILAIEDDYNDFNPYYHTINDNLTLFNLTYFTNFVKASVGTAAHLARPSQAMLAGLVTDAQTSLPIAGARVWATSTITATTLSGSDGRYQLAVPGGEYTLTAAASGYNAKTFAGVVAQDGYTTTRNFALASMAYYTVSGVVSDALTGKPLSATIIITGYPNSPIGTHTLTGRYEVALLAGQTYTFHVTPNAPGYVAGIRSIGPLTANRVEDYPLLPDLAACIAPGYRFIGIREPFDAPGSWIMTGTAGGPVWNLTSPYQRPNHTGGSADFALATGTAASDTLSAELRSPVLDFGALPTVTLAFKTHFDSMAASSNLAEVEVSVDGGATWPHTVWTHADDVLGPHTATLDLSALAGRHGQVRVRFKYTAAATTGFWEVDDVQVGQCLLPGTTLLYNIHLPVVIGN
ncbi:MAG: M20/M25/M40 family metallo-hydrolase [Chloroflexi bacterium]|nr:M20/M25/M40 family metallo-hydrolase [Chloroflexota bacterium]